MSRSESNLPTKSLASMSVPTYLEHIEKILDQKQKLTSLYIQHITRDKGTFDKSYDYFKNKNREKEFLQLSPLFFEKEYGTSAFELILANEQDTIFWRLYNEQNFSLYTEIHLKLFEYASSEQLYSFVCDPKHHSMLKVVIARGFFQKLLQGKNERFSLLEILIKQKDIPPMDKIEAIQLLQEKVELSSIGYCKTVLMNADSREMVENCFQANPAKQQWMIPKNNIPFHLRITNEKLEQFMDNLKRTIATEADKILCQLLIANTEYSKFDALVNYKWSLEKDSKVSDIAQRYIKNQIKNIQNSLPSSQVVKVDSDLKRMLENLIINPKLQRVFSVATGGFSGEELYAISCIADLNPACHKIFADNEFTRALLLKTLSNSNKMENLSKRSPYFFLEQEREYFQDKKTDFFAALLLGENPYIKERENFDKLCEHFFANFNYETLGLILARDPELRNKTLERCTWEKRNKFANYPVLLSFILAGNEFIKQASNPEEKISICLELMEYRKQGYILNEDADEFLASMIDHHHSIFVAMAKENEMLKNLILNLATEMQRQFLLENYPSDFAKFIELNKKNSSLGKEGMPHVPLKKSQTLSFNFNKRSANDTPFDPNVLSVELIEKTRQNLNPNHLNEAKKIINTFMIQDIDPNLEPNKIIEAHLSELVILLKSCTNSKIKAEEIVLDIVQAKLLSDEIDHCNWGVSP